MTIFDKIKLAEGFQNGGANDDSFVDLPHMKPEHLDALATFIGKVVKQEPLVGKNKQSWLNDSYKKIPLTDAYEEGNYWHYHCGPSYSNAPMKSMTYNLNVNLNGITSAEIIHYQKIDDGTVFIVGFSPNHLPFPNSDDPSNGNPLFASDDEDETGEEG